MKIKFIFILMLTVLLGTACTSMQVQKDWQVRKEGSDFQKEKKIYQDRLGNKEMCGTKGLIEFAWKSDTPSKSCLYPTARYLSNPQGPVQYLRLAKVIQITSEGYLVQGSGEKCYGGTCREITSPNIIFIYKTDQKDMTDGSFLDEQNDGTLYEYVGIYTHQTVLGAKTIYSFKKLDRKDVENALKGLKTYTPYHELLADLEMWPNLEASIRLWNREKQSKESK